MCDKGTTRRRWTGSKINMGGCATKTSMDPSSREGEPSDNFEPAGVGQPAVELSEEELELKKKQASVTLQVQLIYHPVLREASRACGI